MRIRDLPFSEYGKAGSNGSWSVHTHTQGDGKVVRTIYHYSTMMLQFNVTDPSDKYVLDFSTGHGSVSDQGGMNQLFRALDLPFYFSRLGGAEIEEVIGAGNSYTFRPTTAREYRHGSL